MTLLEQVGKGLVGQLLQRLHAVARQQVQGVPGLVVELDELASGPGRARLRPLAEPFRHASPVHGGQTPFGEKGLSPFHAIADLSLSTRSVRSQEKPPSLSGSRPKWP